MFSCFQAEKLAFVEVSYLRAITARGVEGGNVSLMMLSILFVQKDALIRSCCLRKVSSLGFMAQYWQKEAWTPLKASHKIAFEGS